jgi:hypothetical protein
MAHKPVSRQNITYGMPGYISQEALAAGIGIRKYSEVL